MSAPCFGLAMGVASQMSSGPRLLTATYFLWLSIVGTVLAGLLLCLMLFGLTLAVRGTWRRGLRFVPSSVHYACAWWPPVSLAALVVSFIQVAWQDSESWPMGIVLLLGLLLWGLWLWGSATEAQHVPQVAVRIIAVTLALSVASFAVMLSVPGYSQRAAAQLVARADSGLLKLNVFGTFTASSVHHRPQTYALIIDMIPSDDEQLVLDGITQLGAPAENRVEIRRKGCTLEQIEKALTTARSELRPEDRFILYINGHGAQQGAGSIAMADGQITSQKLADLLSQLPTTRCLVVIESCFGGKFLPALRDACNATVITSTDNRNLAYRNCLRDFWVALEKATCDQNGDGKVTVNEAFWSAYCELLERGETARQMVLRRVSSNKQRTELFTESGYATPQLEAVGKASKEDFSVPSKQNGRK